MSRRIAPTGSRVAPAACTTLAVLAALAALALSGCARSDAGGWSARAAQHYLDRRAAAWIAWPSAARAQGTVCISCHTALPYLLASDARESRQAGSATPAPQARLLSSILERVRLGMRLPPYYPHQATASRATETVLNALILTDHDAPTGLLSADTQTALAQMWSVQLASGNDAGSWPWIEFNNEPWEAHDSAYFGAVLAALAAERTPAGYRQRPDIQAALARLQSYLASAYAGEPLLNRIDLLWAAGRWPELLAPARRAALLTEIWAQQRADGGWNLASLMPAWRRHDGTAQPSGSDGYATGLVTLALQLSGVPQSDPRLRRGLAWLRTHQSRWTGGWSAASMNHRFRRNPFYDREPRHFMDDAATAYAVLALTQAQSQAGAPLDPPLSVPAAGGGGSPGSSGSAGIGASAGAGGSAHDIILPLGAQHRLRRAAG